MLPESEEAEVNPLSSVVQDILSETVSAVPGELTLQLSPSSILVSGMSSCSIDDTGSCGVLTSDRGVEKLLVSLLGDR